MRGNPLGVQRGDELVPRQAVELLGVVAQGKQMPDGAAAFGQSRRSDAGNLLQVLDQVIGIRAADGGLRDQLVDLLHEHGRLEMLHAIVDAAGEAAFAAEAAGGAWPQSW